VEKLASIGCQVIVPYRGDGMNVRHLKLLGDYGQVVPLPCNIPNEADVRRALSRSNVVINCVGARDDTLNYSLHDANVKTAYRIAKTAKEMGIKHFLHFSALCADANSRSKWLAVKGESESVVRAFLPDATVFRLAHVYGEEDRFVGRLANIAHFSPGIPVLDQGTSRLQPVNCVDVANCVLNALAMPEAAGQTYHLGGELTLTWKELAELVYRGMILTSSTLHLPMPALKAYCQAVGLLPPPYKVLNASDAEEMAIDMVVPSAPDALRMADLRVEPSAFLSDFQRLMIRHQANRESLRTDVPAELDI